MRIDDSQALLRAAAELHARAETVRLTVHRLLPQQGPDVWRGARADRLAADLAAHHRVLAHVATALSDAADRLARRAQAASTSST